MYNIADDDRTQDPVRTQYKTHCSKHHKSKLTNDTEGEGGGSRNGHGY